MAYRGNPALPADTQRRIEGTFEHTLALAEDGHRQEALLGCDFILRMDPRFEPARRLHERLMGASGAVHVRDLLEESEAALPAPPPPAEAAAGFGEEPWAGLDLEDLPELPLAPEGPGAAGGHAALRAELSAFLERRAFGDLLAAAGREREAVADDPELFALVETAQSRLEAEPYVAKFLAGARAAREAGNEVEAERLVAKARSLDPSHPGLAAPAAARPAASVAPSALGTTVPLPQQAPAPPPSPLTQAVPFAADSLFSADTAEFERRAVVAAGESESDRRIADLLAEGQAAYDRADYQGSIDAWSRIFLIDIDHQEAAQRIEQARKLKAEGERQIEEVFHDGLNHLDAGDTAAARRAFEQVLEMQPAHLTARELLQQIEAGKAPPARPAPVSATHERPLGGAVAVPTAAELKEEILVPPEPGEARVEDRRAAVAPRPAAPTRGLRTFALVGGAVALVVLVGAWFLFQNRARLFPNSEEPAATASARTVDPIARATALHRQGRTAFAIAQLRRLPPNDPRYRRAQALIRQWDSSAAPAAPAALDAAQAARREELLAGGRAALGRGDYLAAATAFEQAAAVQPLAPAEAELLRQARVGLEPLAPQLTLFRQQDWEFAVPQLWRMREENPSDPGVNRLLVDSYHNLGVQALQAGDVRAAEAHFNEAVQLAPEDGESRRHLLFAQTYRQRAQDLLFRIYVKYLPFRG